MTEFIGPPARTCKRCEWAESDCVCPDGGLYDTERPAARHTCKEPTEHGGCDACDREEAEHIKSRPGTDLCPGYLCAEWTAAFGDCSAFCPAMADVP